MKKCGFGVLVYKESANTFNIGDYIQSIAAQGFFGDPDCYINREEAALYKGNPVKLIMNGWYTHTKTDNWIPSEKINPLLISFHLNSTAASSILNEKSIRFFKKNQPIGCRDQYTVDLLREKGVDAYFSGCLTLTLDRFKTKNINRNGIYIVDPLYNYPNFNYLKNYPRGILRYILNGNIFKLNKANKHMKNIFSDSLLNKAIYIQQVISGKGLTDSDKFEIARDLLKKYSTAELVITSRIHCALPCLAMGTPVIYINGFDSFVDTCRFEGILNLFNRVDVDVNSGKFTTNFSFEGDKINENIQIVNKDDYLELAMSLKKTCSDFIKES
ncbi:polysaccharide pyruvyl transferase family protein [Acinetobacter haemolyticus]|uniref:polysaccharide pyruvyl transferase family protein n=1 Tax=Acinetobacter haemolyticus TaxID=29430 RepID=UPI000A7EFC07|nr:polysaccharide pyruvyl transferase family protein [Acinetobacter haemolyticus]QHI27676.1 polysaccharide pyruvyl transferase family protein [Acinetobacter haemolyticus]